MKTFAFLTAFGSDSWRISMSLVFWAAMFPHHSATAAQIVDLGSASGFGVLAGSAITDTGGSTITGNVGLYPTSGTAIGITSSQVIGTIYAVDGAGPSGSVNNPTLLSQAMTDLGTAHGAAAGQAPTTSYGAANQELGGLTLVPGVYNDSSTFSIGGTLTLNGNANAVWVFQAGSALTTAASSQIVLEGGALASHVYWELGTSATLGASSDFVGTILASDAITVGAGSTVDGRLLAETDAVTLDHDTITVPTPNTPPGVPDSGSTLLMLSFGATTLLAYRRQLTG